MCVFLAFYSIKICREKEVEEEEALNLWFKDKGQKERHEEGTVKPSVSSELRGT